MMYTSRIPAKLPFEQNEGVVTLTGPVLLGCGCGSVTSRWSIVQGAIETKVAQAKPKASVMVHSWIAQNNLTAKFPVLNKHTYGVVVIPVGKDFEMVNILEGTTNDVIERVKKLLNKFKEMNENGNQTA